MQPTSMSSFLQCMKTCACTRAIGPEVQRIGGDVGNGTWRRTRQWTQRVGRWPSNFAGVLLGRRSVVRAHKETDDPETRNKSVGRAASAWALGAERRQECDVTDLYGRTRICLPRAASG